MKKEDVPQDRGTVTEEYGHEVCYAVSDDGCYSLCSSAGWEVKNFANEQAWQSIEKECRAAYDAIQAGRKSPLAFYQVYHQMDTALLASYVGLPRWRVRRHLKPSVFAKLSSAMRKRYADVFKIDVEQLQHIPGNLNFREEEN